MLTQTMLLLLLPLINSVAAGDARSSDEQGARWRALLGSPKQGDRDRAATKMRRLFQPTHKQTCHNKLLWVQPGISITEVEEGLARLGIDTTKQTVGACGSGWCSRGYRVDECYVLRVRFETPSGVVISSEIQEELEYIWVYPPKGYSGKWVVYFVNGFKSHEINYKDGKYLGQFLNYYPNGQLAYRQLYSQAGIEGEEVGFFQSGRINYRAYHRRGRNVGKWVWYDEEGKIKNEQNYPDQD